MKCVILQYHTEAYLPLMEIVDPNTNAYCAKHGYSRAVTVVKEFSWDLGFRRLERLLDVFDEDRNLKMAWVLGVDTIIMNHHVKIEDRMPPSADLVIARDCNDINADSFLIRNNLWAERFLKEVLSTEEEFMKTQFLEQAAIAEAIEAPHNKEHVKIVPQRAINSYLYADGLNREWGDKWIDHPGKFGRGDWLIHLPGLPLEKRIEAAKKYLPMVVK